MSNPSGSVKKYGKVYRARVVYFDPVTGGKKELVRKRDTKREAKDELGTLEELAARLQNGGRSGTGDELFSDFASYYVKHYSVAPTFTTNMNGTRLQIGGKKTWKQERRTIEVDLVTSFGKLRLRDLTYRLLDTWRINRFEQPKLGKSEATKDRKAPRSLASVHRPLEVLRAMMNVAINDGWMSAPGPFRANRNGASALIQKSKERKRKRLLSVAEEEALLQQLDPDHHPRRRKWYERTIVAIDTGMRRGEIDRCQWWQIDFDRNCILVVAGKVEHHQPRADSEQGEDRIVVMTKRVRQQVLNLRVRAERQSTAGEADSVFPFLAPTNNKTWYAACRDAGVADLHVHDLRHVPGSRLIAMGKTKDQVQLLLGHQQPLTTWRYLHVDLSMQKDAATAIETYRQHELENLAKDGGERPVRRSPHI